MKELKNPADSGELIQDPIDAPARGAKIYVLAGSELAHEVWGPSAIHRSKIEIIYNNDAVTAVLNHDGLTDVAISGPKSSVRLRLQKATSRGSFGPEVSISLPGGVSQLAAGDVDGDGRADLLTWVYTSGSDYMPRGGLAVLFQQPDGSFVVSGVLGPQNGVNIERLAIADADGDGRRDLLAYLTPWSTDYGAGLLVVPQIAPRLFGTPVYTPLCAIQGIDDAAFSDLNGDGLPDVVAAGFWPESGGPLRAPNVIAGEPDVQQRQRRVRAFRHSGHADGGWPCG